jgi:hypothetical protein
LSHALFFLSCVLNNKLESKLDKETDIKIVKNNNGDTIGGKDWKKKAER